MTNPDPSIYRLYAVPNTWRDQDCGNCGGHLPVGQIIDVEYELGPVHHDDCPDD